MKFLILSGPNLNLLGLRQPELYGKHTYDDLCHYVDRICRDLGVEAEFYQSNHEGDLVDAVQQARGRFDALILNPAAYSHTSIAILDALKAVELPAVEVHLTDIHARERFRHVSITSLGCQHLVKGKGLAGYAEAVAWLVRYLDTGGSELRPKH